MTIHLKVVMSLKDGMTGKQADWQTWKLTGYFCKSVVITPNTL